MHRDYDFVELRIQKKKKEKKHKQLNRIIINEIIKISNQKSYNNRNIIMITHRRIQLNFNISKIFDQ